MYEIAFAIGPLVGYLDFSDETTSKSSEDVQIAIIKRIRKSLNITSFFRGVDRDRIGRTDNVG